VKWTFLTIKDVENASNTLEVTKPYNMVRLDYVRLG
jgi:hypothetical protein